MVRSILILTLLFFSGYLSSYSQEMYTWERANLVIPVPFNLSEVDVFTDEEELLIETDAIDLEFFIIPRDSVEGLAPDPFQVLIQAVVASYELIILSHAEPFPLIQDGWFITALDTLVFPDSLVLGICMDKGSDDIIIALFDCYEIPLSTGIQLMKGLRFAAVPHKEEDNPEQY